MENNTKIIEGNIKNKSEETKKSSGNALAITFSSLALVFALGSCFLSFLTYQDSLTPITFLGSGTDGNSANFVEGSIADVANSVEKSVVSILTETRTMSYFGGASTSAAAGTGMLVTENGYILTNKHVVDGANKIYVVLADGTEYENVELITTDPLNDVAVLKIPDVSGLSPVTLGDSKTISVGQQVIAIGNALGQYQNTVTSGIISGTGRNITATDESYSSSETLTDMIQTDAAINSGNSGGPLVNAAGEVIGINTAVYSDGNNIGFAIPISSVKGLLNNIIENNSTTRAYAGIYYSNITTDLAKAYNLPVTAGAYVYSNSVYSSVISGSPAEKAGLKDKDIIISVNGVKIGKAGSFSSLIGEYKPGDTVELLVLRNGNEIGIKLTLGEYKAN
ncbi:trypsin-like peptidase domain-containing protein [Candidatus Saccharibacteria bacterium]|nr:trypsin-like peptidase domain-containing protein [Candidatus Saccharibacteria bacterium]MBQ6147316.1 trypsin-like peptidase domain-containing protein [Candidatus Saccharibacteria bacterium]